MINLPEKWNLDVLYSSFESKEFLADIELFRKTVKEINAFARKELASTDNAVEKIETFIKRDEECDNFQKLFSYCHLSVSGDATNAPAGKYLSVLMDIAAEGNEAQTAFKSFIGRVGNIGELAAKSEIIKEREFVLNEIASNYKHLLSEKEEMLFTKLALTGSTAWRQMKEELYATVTTDVPGIGEGMTLPAVRNLAYHADKDVRKKGYEAELEAYKRIEVPAAYAINGIKGEVITSSAARGYASPFEMTLENSRVDKETFDAMMSAMKDSFPSFRKYFRKKAELLGYKGGLPFYDLFAPVGKADMSYTYPEAAEFVVKQFSLFSERLGNFARHAFENGWIDALPRKGKRGGAFCSGLRVVGESRILSNFSGSFSNLTTLAHELGHAFHNDCIKNEVGMNTSYTMPIAETASTFCETLVCEASLKTATKDEALVITENDISGVAQVIIDIYSRFLFEDEVFNKRKNSTLTPDELKGIMLEAQKQAYGDGLDENILHPYMWVCKPHYYYADANYYNWPYAFGQLFSKGLYAEYLKQGEAFVPKYEALLAATGKNSAYDIARIAGINIRDKAFWAASLKLTENDIEKFCEL